MEKQNQLIKTRTDSSIKVTLGGSKAACGFLICLTLVSFSMFKMNDRHRDIRLERRRPPSWSQGRVPIQSCDWPQEALNRLHKSIKVNTRLPLSWNTSVAAGRDGQRSCSPGCSCRRRAQTFKVSHMAMLALGLGIVWRTPSFKVQRWRVEWGGNRSWHSNHTYLHENIISKICRTDYRPSAIIRNAALNCLLKTIIAAWCFCSRGTMSSARSELRFVSKKQSSLIISDK